MDAPAVLYALRWMIHDTFRQTITSRVFWILLGLSALCIVFCLGVGIEGGAVREGHELFGPDNKPLVGQKTGRLTLLFGLFPLDTTREPEREVNLLYTVFGSWFGGPVGVLVALIFAAGFVPESLQPANASVLLSKPAPRWLVLLGKYVGVVCFIGLHVAIFFLGTWFALGIKTNVWHPEYLMGIPLMIFHFAVVYAFSVMIAVLTRSTMACVVAGVLFWIVCYAVNYGRHFAVAYEWINSGGAPLPSFTVLLSEIGYWLLPKPLDLTILLERSLNLDSDMATLADKQPVASVLAHDLFHPIAVILTSCLFPIFALWASASQLAKTDY
jgi:ABC-type transport system involved in multi-copper enzyme maturation permease subunit